MKKKFFGSELPSDPPPAEQLLGWAKKKAQQHANVGTLHKQSIAATTRRQYDGKWKSFFHYLNNIGGLLFLQEWKRDNLLAGFFYENRMPAETFELCMRALEDFETDDGSKYVTTHLLGTMLTLIKCRDLLNWVLSRVSDDIAAEWCLFIAGDIDNGGKGKVNSTQVQKQGTGILTVYYRRGGLRSRGGSRRRRGGHLV